LQEIKHIIIIIGRNDKNNDDEKKDKQPMSSKSARFERLIAILLQKSVKKSIKIGKLVDFIAVNCTSNRPENRDKIIGFYAIFITWVIAEREKNQQP
jgi:hypothetical protein